MLPKDPLKTFKIVTLGCRTNQYESQAFQDQLSQMGYQKAEGNEISDLCIVNTCTITESADSSSRNTIRQLAKENPGSKLIVTGCYAERKPHDILAIEGVTHVVSNKDKEELISKIFTDVEVPEFSIKHFDAHTRAFLKVQDGCNSYCSYCIIPYVRGRSRSRRVSALLEEAKSLIANGYKEIVLTGINIGDFDGAPLEGEPPVRLAELVRTIDAIPGLERLRVSSIDPDEVDDDLADAILNGKKTCKSMHIVLQSGSNVILKRMNRKYTRQIFLDTVEKLRLANSDFTFTTDIIVGFPGETEFDFQETLDVMDRVKFVKIHMFPFSKRQRTRAAIMPNQVPVDIIKERKQKILQVAEEIAFAQREKFVGRKMSVLTESKDSGHTDNFLTVSLLDIDEKLLPNQLLEVELIDNTPSGLIGKVCALQ